MANYRSAESIRGAMGVVAVLASIAVCLACTRGAEDLRDQVAQQVVKVAAAESSLVKEQALLKIRQDSLEARIKASVALGMVLQTKFTRDPGERYRKWFRLYREYEMYDMEWVNIPYYAWAPVETYLLRDEEKKSGGTP